MIARALPKLPEISKLTSEIPIPNTDVLQNTDTEYQTDMKNTDTDSKYR